MKSFEEVYEIVKETLSPKRFEHCINVMDRCIEFAKIFGEDIEKAKLIGIAHDIAKEIPRDKRVEYAEKDEVILTDFEKENTSLVHAKHGAVICKRDFEFSEDMCDAISYHTTAKPNMSRLAKILYLADFSEETRPFQEALEAYNIGKKDLDEAYIYALIGKIKYMLKDRVQIHQDSIDAYNSIVKK